jgi:hypothetical protein
MKVIKHLHRLKLDDFLEVLVKLGGEAIRGLIPFHLKDHFLYLNLTKRCCKKDVLLIGNLSDVIYLSLVKSEITLL